MFAKGAPVAEHFTAAIKFWGINNPSILQIENQGLTDNHIKILCAFLKDKNMIHTLNLRRNYITNIGVAYLIDFLAHDETLTSMDVSRNKISE